MEQHVPSGSEHNSVSFSGSTINGAAIATGSGARASVGSPDSGDQVATAIAELRRAVDDTRAQTDVRDDETHASLALALTKLAALEAELAAHPPKRDWKRVSALLSGVQGALGSLTTLTVQADSLRSAIEQVAR